MRHYWGTSGDFVGNYWGTRLAVVRISCEHSREIVGIREELLRNPCDSIGEFVRHYLGSSGEFVRNYCGSSGEFVRNEEGIKWESLVN